MMGNALDPMLKRQLQFYDAVETYKFIISFKQRTFFPLIENRTLPTNLDCRHHSFSMEFLISLCILLLGHATTLSRRLWVSMVLLFIIFIIKKMVVSITLRLALSTNPLAGECPSQRSNGKVLGLHSGWHFSSAQVNSIQAALTRRGSESMVNCRSLEYPLAPVIFSELSNELAGGWLATAATLFIW